MQTQSDPSRERRFKIFTVSAELLVEFMRGSRGIDSDGKTTLVAVENFPDDMEICGVRYDEMRNAFDVRVASASFPLLQECCAAETFEPRYTCWYVKIDPSEKEWMRKDAANNPAAAKLFGAFLSDNDASRTVFVDTPQWTPGRKFI